MPVARAVFDSNRVFKPAVKRIHTEDDLKRLVVYGACFVLVITNDYFDCERSFRLLQI